MIPSRYLPGTQPCQPDESPDFALGLRRKQPTMLVVHEADGLHERVADLWAHEAEAAPDQALLRARDRGVSAGRSRRERGAFTIGRPSTNLQR